MCIYNFLVFIPTVFSYTNLIVYVNIYLYKRKKLI